MPLLGLADLTLMGHSGETVNIGAISFGSIIFSYLYWGFSFLRMGTSGMTAQSYGKHDLNEAFHILLRSLLIAFAGGFLLLLFQKPVSFISFFLLDGSSEVETIAQGYFNIRIYAAPATLAIYAFAGWFLGMQNSIIPMIVAISSNIINILLNIFFVTQLNMGAEGVALGTVAAQYTGLLIFIIAFFKKFSHLIAYASKAAIINIIELKRFVTVNSDIFVRTIVVIFILSFVQSQSAAINDKALAVSSIFQQFLLFFSFFIDGMAHAAEALTGRYFGAREPKNLKRAIRLIACWGIIIGLFFSLLYLIKGNFIFGLITDIQNVINYAKPYMFWLPLLPLAAFAGFILDGIYIGATATKTMRNVMVLTGVFFFFPAYLSLRSLDDLHALWFGMTLFFAGRGILQGLLFRKRILSTVSS